MKKYYGNYIGMVVQSNDPEHRGRVKVFVPHISTTLHANWNANKKDKNFVFPGDDNVDLTSILPTLKNVLPWAECAAPLFGGSASGRYNAVTNKGTVSDSNQFEQDKFIEGNRPTQNYVGENVYPDDFKKPGRNRFVNSYAYQYTPSEYSNLAKGMFSIPNVGAHVWVFFTGGNPNLPVYFAVSHGQEDWEGIYSTDQDSETSFSSTDYPGAYENIGTSEEGVVNNDSKTFRAKNVFNSNKHTIELVDTDKHEILKMTHFSGSFKEFTNYANIELATNNDQKLVVGDQFLNVKKNQSIWVAEHQEIIVDGDQFLTIGDAAKADVQTVYDSLKDLHETKLLFDIMRAKKGTAPNDVSSLQQKAGYGVACPICMNVADVVFGVVQPPLPTGLQLSFSDIAPVPLNQGVRGFYAGFLCDVCNGTETLLRTPGISPSTQDGIWLPDPQKKLLQTKMIAVSQARAKAEAKLGAGDQIIDITKNKVETIGLVMNDLKSFRVDPVGKLRIRGVHVALGGTYETYETSPHVEYVDVDDVPGGDYNLTCTNKYKLLVGARGINIKTFGPIDMYGTIVNMTGEQVNISSQNEVLIDGGERFSIRARKISLIPFGHAPVVVDGQLHVTRNAVIKGGAYVEGEMAIQHVTAPFEWANTYGVADTVGPVPDHYHSYMRIPTTFMPAKEGVRDTMSGKGINLDNGLAIASALPGSLSVNALLAQLGIDPGKFNSDIAGPSDQAAAAYEFAASPVGRGEVTGTANGNIVTFVIKYNYNSNVDGSFHPNGITVTTTFDTADGQNERVGPIKVEGDG